MKDANRLELLWRCHCHSLVCSLVGPYNRTHVARWLSENSWRTCVRAPASVFTNSILAPCATGASVIAVSRSAPEGPPEGARAPPKSPPMMGEADAAWRQRRATHRSNPNAPKIYAAIDELRRSFFHNMDELQQCVTQAAAAEPAASSSESDISSTLGSSLELFLAAIPRIVSCAVQQTRSGGSGGAEPSTRTPPADRQCGSASACCSSAPASPRSGGGGAEASTPPAVAVPSDEAAAGPWPRMPTDGVTPESSETPPGHHVTHMNTICMLDLHMPCVSSHPHPAPPRLDEVEAAAPTAQLMITDDPPAAAPRRPPPKFDDLAKYIKSYAASDDLRPPPPSSLTLWAGSQQSGDGGPTNASRKSCAL